MTTKTSIIDLGEVLLRVTESIPYEQLLAQAGEAVFAHSVKHNIDSMRRVGL